METEPKPKLELELEHRSHYHPLFLHEKGDSGTPALCQGCGKGISGLSYSCSQKCCFDLHKICAELSVELKHPMHPQHPLYLFVNPPYPDGGYICDVCRAHRENYFSFNCAYCDFGICIWCILEEGKKIEHTGHHHPLNLVQRQASFHCDACGTEDKLASSYLCSVCPFWIHRDCASLPSTIKCSDYHNHPLTLEYSLSHEYYKSEIKCNICDNKKVEPPKWFYHCAKCKYFAHVKCATSKTEPPSRSDKK